MGINQGPEDGSKKSKQQQQKTKPAPLKKEKGIIPSDYACALKTLEEKDVPENEVRILLLGVDGSGKTSIANLITGGASDRASSGSTSETDGASRELSTETDGASRESSTETDGASKDSTPEKDGAMGRLSSGTDGASRRSKRRASTYSTCVRNGRRFVVVDSPCLFHTRIAPKFVITEVNKLIGLTSPGPHICIFVVPSVDLSSEQKQAMARIQNAFFPGAADNSLVVLTKGDICKSLTVDEYTSNAAPVVKNIIKKCNNRIVQINNVTDEKNDAIQLFDMIEHVLNNNKQGYYTNDVYTLAQVNLKMHKTQSKEKYMATDKGITLLEKIKRVERMRERAETNETDTISSEAELNGLCEDMIEVVCDDVRDGILAQSITPFEMNLRRLITSGTKALGSFLTSFLWFTP